MMCEDQEYVKNYKYDLISHVLYQCAFLTLTVYNSEANKAITFALSRALALAVARARLT